MSACSPRNCVEHTHNNQRFVEKLPFLNQAARARSVNPTSYVCGRGVLYSTLYRVCPPPWGYATDTDIRNYLTSLWLLLKKNDRISCLRIDRCFIPLVKSFLYGLCPLLKKSPGSPYQKILDFSPLFVVDASIYEAHQKNDF